MKQFFLLLIFVPGFVCAMTKEKESQGLKMAVKQVVIESFKSNGQYIYRVTSPPIKIPRKKKKKSNFVPISPSFCCAFSVYGNSPEDVYSSLR